MTAVDHYEAEAEATRERIAAAIDTLSHRLDPSRIVREVREDTARWAEDAAGEAGDFVRDNAAPLAAAGAGLLALLIARRSARHGRSSYAFAQSDMPTERRPGTFTRARNALSDAGHAVGGGLSSAGHAVGDGLSSAGHALRDGAASVRDRAANLVDRAGETAGDAAERAEDALRAARAHAAELAQRTGHAARGVADDTGQLIQSHPTEALLVALAAGATLALATGVELDFES